MTSDADSGSADYGGIELDVLQCLCLGLAGQFAACSIDDEDCHSLGLQLAAGSAFDGSGKSQGPATPSAGQAAWTHGRKPPVESWAMHQTEALRKYI